jgi:hypothetical protein
MKFPKSFENENLNKKWVELKKIRDICNISIETKRASKEIGSSLETNLIINLNKDLFEISNDTSLKLAFANGGDQNNSTIPEKKICEQFGIELIDGLGDKIQSSSWLLKK